MGSTRAGEFKLGARLRNEGGRKLSPSRECGSGRVLGISQYYHRKRKSEWSGKRREFKGG
jgi:hypothetical protein